MVNLTFLIFLATLCAMSATERELPSSEGFDRVINRYINAERTFLNQLSSAYDTFFGSLGKAIPEGRPGFKIDRYDQRNPKQISYITLEDLNGSDLIRRLDAASAHWRESRVLSLITSDDEVNFYLTRFKTIGIQSSYCDYIQANLPGSGFCPLEFLYGARNAIHPFFKDLRLDQRARVFSGMIKVVGDLAAEKLSGMPSVAISA